MNTLFDILRESYPDITASTTNGLPVSYSGAKYVDPTEAARNKVLSKVEETIAGLVALAAGKEWPVSKGKKRDRKFAQWYVYNSVEATYSVYVKYGAKYIYGIFGFDDATGEPKKFLRGIKKDQLLDFFKSINTAIKEGQVDSFILTARDEASAKMKAARAKAA